MSIQKISALIKKEFVLEFRQRASLSGVFLYLAGCVYVCYLAVRKIEEIETWNALLWVLLLFNAILTVSKSFLSETKGRSLYNYTIYNPKHLILAKLFYNMFLVLVVSLLGFFFYSVFIGNPVKNIWLFICNLSIASLAFSGVLTMTAGIASKTNGGFTLMSILSIPLLFPLMLIAIRVSILATLGSTFVACSNYLLALAALNTALVLLCYLLFPYIWRD